MRKLTVWVGGQLYKERNKISQKKKYKWPMGLRKKYSGSLAIRETQIKTLMRYHLNTIGIAILQKAE